MVESFNGDDGLSGLHACYVTDVFKSDVLKLREALSRKERVIRGTN